MRRLALVAALGLVGSGGQACAGSADGLQSPDPTARCDAFFRRFGWSASGPAWEALHGKTTAEVRALLGSPSEVLTLEHEGVTWLDAVYRFDGSPAAQAPACRLDAAKQGSYSPSVLFRNGVAVPWAVFEDQTEIRLYRVPPEHLRFKEGGAFP